LSLKAPSESERFHWNGFRKINSKNQQQMNYTENFEGIKLDVQAVDITISNDIQQEIRDMILRLRRHVSEVNWVDVYFNEKSGKSTKQRSVSVRFGIPGNDAFASDSGGNFMALLKSVEEKLRRQLEKK
jgi:ribosomal subunit interface protein